MKNILIVLGLLCFSSVALGAESHFVIPPQGPLKYSYSVDEKLKDHFKGTVTLGGKLVFEPFPYDNLPEIVVPFVPDADSRKKLPYKTGLGPVKSVGILGDKKQLLALLSEDQKKNLLARAFPSIEVRTTIVATDYLSEVSCDNTNYWIHIVRIIKSTETPKPSTLRASAGGCG
jgi:hypothetical protein